VLSDETQSHLKCDPWQRPYAYACPEQRPPLRLSKQALLGYCGLFLDVDYIRTAKTFPSHYQFFRTPESGVIVNDSSQPEKSCREMKNLSIGSLLITKFKGNNHIKSSPSAYLSWHNRLMLAAWISDSGIGYDILRQSTWLNGTTINDLQVPRIQEHRSITYHLLL
jgi:hypothetical protein